MKQQLNFTEKSCKKDQNCLKNQQVLALESNKKIQKLENQLEKKNTLIIPLIHLLTLDKTLMHKKNIYY